jgi:hypothetical protein
VPAEQNHASMVAHLGKRVNWSVIEHMSQLCNQQAHIVACKFCELDNHLYVQVSWYKLELVCQNKKDDKSLSGWAYKKLFVTVLKSAEKLG